MIYEWRKEYSTKVDAQIAGEMCEHLEKTVGLTPRNLVDANRDVNAPLHSEFEWDNNIASEKYRDWQARRIIGCLCVSVKEVEKQPKRAFYSISTENDRKYENIDVIIKDTKKAETLLQTAYRELLHFRDKYEALKELSCVFNAIDSLEVE